MKPIGTKRSGVDKATCQKWHCLKRMRERLRVPMSEERYGQIVSAILDCQSRRKPRDDVSVKHLRNQTARVSEFEVKLEESPVRFIACFDRQRQTIATILFPTDECQIDLHQYRDYFGNTVNARLEYGKYFTLNTEEKKLSIPATSTVLVREDERCQVYESEDGKVWTWWMEEKYLEYDLK